MNVLTLLGILGVGFCLIHETASQTCAAGQILSPGVTTTFTNDDGTARWFNTVYSSIWGPYWTAPYAGQVLSSSAAYTGGINNGNWGVQYYMGPAGTYQTTFVSGSNIVITTSLVGVGVSFALTTGQTYRFAMSTLSGGRYFNYYGLSSGELWYSLQYQSNPSCTVCAAGTYSDTSTQTCLLCQAGSFCVNGISTPCVAGTFSATGASSCSTCPLNTNSLSGASTCSASAGYYDLGKSLMAYYTFEAGTAITADSSSNQLGALTQSTTPVTSVSSPGGTTGKTTNTGNVASFNQTGSNGISTDTAKGQSFTLPSFSRGSSFSVCLWYMPGSPVNGRSYDRMLDFGNGGSNNGNMICGHKSTGHYVEVYLYSGTTPLSITSWSTYMVANKWVHLCVALSGNTGYAYLNNVQKTISMSGSITTGTYNTNYIARSSGAQSLFAGYIDEVRLYPRTLTAAEVTAIYSYSSQVTTALMPVMCGAGTYTSSTGNTVCTNCRVCGAGQYASTACSSISDTVCTACAPPCVAGSYMQSACNATSDTLCTSCTVCGTGKYVYSPCTLTNNTVCVDCTVCGSDSFASTACVTI